MSEGIFESGCQVLVAPVNCVGVMGKGLALSFKERFPEVFASYARACASKELRPGRVLTVPVASMPGAKWVVNFPTKRHWRDSSRLEDIRSGLLALADELRRLGANSVAVPALGCGLGGLNWGEVEPMIAEALGQVPGLQVVVFPPR